MKVIVCAATKGGTGKSTLSYAIAHEAVKTGSVYLLDLDPQKSLTQLYEARRDSADEGKPRKPMLLVGKYTTVRETVRMLIENGHERDFLIIDTPGSHMDIIQDALNAADAIVLPVRPSPLDLLAQEDVGRLVDEMGKARQTLFVVNCVDNRAGIGNEAIDRVMHLLPNPPVKIAQRVDYARAAIAGLTGAEINKQAAEEVAELWRAINRIVMKGSVINGGKTEPVADADGPAVSKAK